MKRAFSIAMDVLCGAVFYGGGAVALFFLGIALGARIAG